jgi:hypothetical protein
MRYQAALLPVLYRTGWSDLIDCGAKPRIPAGSGVSFFGDFLCAGFRGGLFLGPADRIAQRFAGGECGNAARGDDEFLTRLGVASFALFAVANDETAERDELHFIARLQRRFDFIEQHVDHLADLPFRQLKLVCQRVDKICLRQLNFLKTRARHENIRATLLPT